MYRYLIDHTALIFSGLFFCVRHMSQRAALGKVEMLREVGEFLKMELPLRRLRVFARV